MSSTRKHLGLVSLISLAAVLATVPLSAMAGLIFRIQQVTPTGSIVIPQAATFAVTVESDSGNQPITGIDFDVTLSDQAKKGGVITSGSNLLFPGGTNGFYASDFPPQGQGLTVGYATFSNTPVTMTATPTTIATFTLDTAGVDVVEGPYSISFDPVTLAANDTAFLSVPVTGVPTTYTLQVVPEPSTMAMTGLALAGGMAMRWKSKRHRRSATSGSA